VIALGLALLAAYGVFLVYTSVAFRWRGVGLGPRVSRRPAGRRARHRWRTWLAQAGLDEVPTAELAGVVGTLAIGGAVVGWALFGGPLPALLLGAAGAALPMASFRQRRVARRAAAQDAWPRLIEEIRVLTSSVGRSIPQALFEVGARGPAELRPAFDAAHREWLITTDFARTIEVLKSRLADPTADAACETLLVAFEVGGADLDQRLEALADDRRADSQGRKDARARQAGVRFARRFTLLVPLGMALTGLTIGDGRAAYQTPLGQLAVFVALGSMGACWLWASRYLRLPESDRVFTS
jgi:tight adherence protein B